MLLFLALVFATWRVHADPGDAQLYQVVARHMVEDGEWLSLRYLPSVYPRFFEHLPFGLWPYALVARWVGEWGLRPLSAALSVGTLLWVGRVARRGGGRHAGWVAMLALGLADGFFLRGGHPYLEPPLLLLATGAAVPLLLPEPVRGREWAMAGVLAALACAVKGPFGVLPFAGAAGARAVEERSVRTLLLGTGVGVLAVVPVGVFLALSPEWWEGYGRNQLLASALGQRVDGHLEWYLPWVTVVRRFWPGLPLLVPGVVLAVGGPASWLRALTPGGEPPEARRAARVLLYASLFVLAGLCVPSRKLWFHAMVVFPLLAMLAGVGVGPWLGAKLAAPGREAGVRRGLWVAVGVAWLAAAAGAGRPLVSGPCVVAGPLAPLLEDVEAGADVLVVAPGHEWTTLSAVALERAWVPWPLKALGPARAREGEGPARARVAFVADGAPVEAAGWREVGRAGRWRLLRR